MKIVVREDDLTLQDNEDFEDYTGKPIEEAFVEKFVRDEDGGKVFDDKGRPLTETSLASAKCLTALVWILGRKDAGTPDFSIEDARAVKVTTLQIVPSSEDAPNPKETDA